MKPTTVITTERLLLRSVTQQDFGALYVGVFSDAEVMLHLSGAPMEHGAAEEVFKTVFDHVGDGRKAGVLVEAASNDVIGYAGLIPCPALGADDFEIGFVLRRSSWGLGYATEIGRGQLEYGFRTTTQPRLLAQVRPANKASAHALRKIGMVFEKDYERPGRGTWQVFSRQREA